MYAGIDYDTNAVHVVLVPEEGKPEYLPFVMHGVDPFDRARIVRDVMPARGWWADEGIVAIGIEEQASGSPKMRASVQKLKMIQGAILACLPAGDSVVEPFLPNEWRKEIGLAGNASKEDVAAWMGEQVWPDAPLPVVPSWPQDACDAYCIARAVERRTAPR